MPRPFPWLRLLSDAFAAEEHVSDAELLRRFAEARDAAAFELLVRRHADAIWKVCRGVLRHDADAEDAFQATFLILVRKPGAIRSGCVAGWLYRAAVNVALKARARAARIPQSTDDLTSHPSPVLDAVDPEILAAIHNEIARLPERYRLPVVLCDLEGHTHAEAAKSLGWPIGSVSGRLSRAHGILRDRLVRRGIGVAPSAALAVVGAAPGGVIRASAAVASGLVVASPAVSTLAEGVLFAMQAAKLKLTAAIAVGLIGVAGAGTMVAMGNAASTTTTTTAATAPTPPPGPAKFEDVLVQPAKEPWMKDGRTETLATAFPDIKPPSNTAAPGEKAIDPEEYEKKLAKLCPHLLVNTPLPVEPKDDVYRALLKARLEAARIEWMKTRELIAVGKWNASDFTGSTQILDDIREAVLELYSGEPKTLVSWLEEVLILSKEIERFTYMRVETGQDPPQSTHHIARFRLKIESALWKAKHPPKR